MKQKVEYFKYKHQQLQTNPKDYMNIISDFYSSVQEWEPIKEEAEFLLIGFNYAFSQNNLEEFIELINELDQSQEIKSSQIFTQFIIQSQNQITKHTKEYQNQERIQDKLAIEKYLNKFNIKLIQKKQQEKINNSLEQINLYILFILDQFKGEIKYFNYFLKKNQQQIISNIIQQQQLFQQLIEILESNLTQINSLSAYNKEIDILVSFLIEMYQSQNNVKKEYGNKFQILNLLLLCVNKFRVSQKFYVFYIKEIYICYQEKGLQGLSKYLQLQLLFQIKQDNNSKNDIQIIEQQIQNQLQIIQAISKKQIDNEIKESKELINHFQSIFKINEVNYSNIMEYFNLNIQLSKNIEQNEEINEIIFLKFQQELTKDQQKQLFNLCNKYGIRFDLFSINQNNQQNQQKEQLQFKEFKLYQISQEEIEQQNLNTNYTKNLQIIESEDFLTWTEVYLEQRKNLLEEKKHQDSEAQLLQKHIQQQKEKLIENILKLNPQAKLYSFQISELSKEDIKDLKIDTFYEIYKKELRKQKKSQKPQETKQRVEPESKNNNLQENQKIKYQVYLLNQQKYFEQEKIKQQQKTPIQFTQQLKANLNINNEFNSFIQEISSSFQQQTLERQNQIIEKNKQSLQEFLNQIISVVKQDQRIYIEEREQKKSKEDKYDINLVGKGQLKQDTSAQQQTKLLVTSILGKGSNIAQPKEVKKNPIQTGIINKLAFKK